MNLLRRWPPLRSLTPFDLYVTSLKDAEREWRWRARRLQILCRLGELGARASDVDTLCLEALKGAAEGLGVTRAGILLREDSTYRFHAARGLSGRFQARFARQVWGAFGGDLEEFVCHDTRRLPDGPLHQSLLEEGVLSLALIPLDHHDGKLGALVMCHDRRHTWPDEDLEAARAIARHVATAEDRRRRERALALSERRLHELKEDLEQRVRERTHEAEHRAERARAMALELARTEERERQRIAQVLHDDLQQYLVAARVQARTLEQKTARQGEVAAIAAKLTRLLDEALEATRALTRELSPPILKTSGLVASLEWLAGWMGDRHGLAVRIESTPECDQVNDDAKLFAFQAVREMLLNVVKHSGVSSAAVTLGPCDGQVLVQVIDEGAGFNPEALEGNGKGMGLGLGNLKQRVRDLGGDVLIHSKPGEGTRIRFTLPITPREEPVAAPPGAPPAALSGTAAFPSRPGIRVLVADDHPLVRQGIVSLLESEPDIRVVGEAGNGAEVVGRARELEPDVVVMDVRMPVMDGIEATRRIRETLPATQIVALSQYGEDEVGVRMRAAGACMFCSKDDAHRSLAPVIRALKEGNGTAKTSTG